MFNYRLSFTGLGIVFVKEMALWSTTILAH